MNIRQNAEELQDILQDLNKWEDEMKTKDNELLKSKTVHKQVWVLLADFTFFCFFKLTQGSNFKLKLFKLKVRCIEANCR